MNAQRDSYDIVVSVGTDHHRFDRLIDWVDRSLELWNGPVPSCLVQHGASREPRSAHAVNRMPREQLLDYYRKAGAVVVQGGPGSILDAREAGRLPLVVPRVPDLHEVVDGHQPAFSAVMVRHGNAIVAETWEEFDRQLHAMTESPLAFATEPRTADPDAAAALLGRHIGGILERPTRRRGVFRRLRQVLRRSPATGGAG